ncbi:hypothetical protein EDD17DRAFT_1512001 [Pisolithus thermaeus]|nr:hypothetical protein EV401DRAFT_1886939 [Pisolithus croceorrhizus]KAI6158613.1 hypothetical protein EDD17DRAFT_1512001 [Pisolithus thermaeus]
MAFAVKAIRAALDTFKMGDVMAPLCHVTCRGAVEQGNFSATPSADERRGPLIGTLVGIVLHGITFLLAFFYFQTYVDDRMGLKLLVALVVTAFLRRLMLRCASITVCNLACTLGLTAVYLVVFLIDFVACLYFKWRVWRFTKKMWIVIFTAMNVRSGYPSALTTLVRYPSLYHEPGSNRPLLAGSALFLFGDIFSASMMAYYPKKNRRGLQRCNHSTMPAQHRMIECGQKKRG